MITVLFFWLSYAFMIIIEASVSLREAVWVRWLPVSCLGIGIGLFCSVVVPTLPTFGNSLWTDGDATKFGFGAFSFNYWCNKAASELRFAVGIS